MYNMYFKYVHGLKRKDSHIEGTYGDSQQRNENYF